MGLEKKYYDHYWSKGWVVVEDVFRSEEADRVTDLAMAITQREYAGLEKGYLVDGYEDGKPIPRKLDDAFLKDQGFRDFILNQGLRECIQTLIGKKPILVSDQLFFKPPRHGSAKPYHQDNFYFRCDPADQVITVWIALDDVDVTNGCLRYIDGSHLGPILPHEPIPGEEEYNSAPPPELIDLSKESAAPVRKGGVVFHHSQTLHTSHRNESDRWRRAYASHWVTVGVTCEIGTLDNAHYGREEFRALFL